jgi:hypothetical protein
MRVSRRLTTQTHGPWPTGPDIARARAQNATLPQIAHVLASMPASNEVEKRDRALIAFTIVTGARCNALACFRMRHLNLETRMVFQDAREVKTKRRKTFETWFFPVGDDIEQVVIDWGKYLIEEKLWGLDDPLFPATKTARGSSGGFEPIGIDRRAWTSTGPIRAIFREAFNPIRTPSGTRSRRLGVTNAKPSPKCRPGRRTLGTKVSRPRSAATARSSRISRELSFEMRASDWRARRERSTGSLRWLSG